MSHFMYRQLIIPLENKYKLLYNYNRKYIDIESYIMTITE